ncbi:OapC/ArvC family zinc-ribbon domain-containing protein [Haloarchaeobius salinus]|uniref:OapC/ArvC family zinc-ribbon domain-containing protein n=1 Tax=Haloarchaeobius salinus TaxID=1198298 RepID=UPI00210A54A9|nr:Zn-ribbon containing protein [Haloarchaeobius salinus]
MPHQCTDCGRTFEDGSKEMLSGCPDCGGNKFQFIPADAVDESVEANSPGEPPSRSSSAGAVSKAATTVRDWVGGGSDDADRPSDRERPSGDRPTSDRPSGEWPKSATEDYDTPAEKAAARGDDEAGASGDTSATVDATADASTADATGDASTTASSTADAQSEAASTTHTDPASDDGTIQARTAGDEDNAQASARSDVVSPDELPEGTATPPADEPGTTDAPASDSGSAPEPEAAAGGRGSATERPGAPDVPGTSPDTADDRHEVADPADTQIEDRPDLDELREELNQQFESIKILNPGQYELNLMELYDREEYIISLREDGRYVIDVPDSWRGDD